MLKRIRGAKVHYESVGKVLNALTLRVYVWVYGLCVYMLYAYVNTRIYAIMGMYSKMSRSLGLCDTITTITTQSCVETWFIHILPLCGCVVVLVLLVLCFVVVLYGLVWSCMVLYCICVWAYWSYMGVLIPYIGV